MLNHVLGNREDLRVAVIAMVVLFAVLIGLYKASGRVDRINAALHPLI